MKIEKNNFVPDKLDYVRGQRPPVACILCAVAANDPQVSNLVLFRRNGLFVTLNLYPYNPGHLMIVPERHCVHLNELSDDEALEIHRLQLLTLRVLEETYRPDGFNLGYNIGPSSGASIDHLHLQIVPRYPTEVGFFDILSDSRVIVEDPKVTKQKLEENFARAARS